MADKNIINKVKELIDTNASPSLKEAAQKWLDEADAKYGDKFDSLKEKGGEAWDKLNDAAAKYSDFAVDANEKLKGVSEKVAEKAEGFSEKAAPVVGDLKEKAAPVVDKVTELEFIKQLKESVSTFTDNIEFFGSDAAKESFGEEAAEQIRKHAEAMKAEGKTFCDCPACTKAREILRELGEDLEEPEVGE